MGFVHRSNPISPSAADALATRSAMGPQSGVSGQIPSVVRVEHHDLPAAAARLMADQHPDPYHAGDRFLEAAAMLHLDLGWFWGVPHAQHSGEFSQVLLAVVSSGRTAMLFLSPPPHPKGLWKPSGRGVAAVAEARRAQVERSSLLEFALPCLAGSSGEPGRPVIVLAQALLEPPALSLVEAFTAGGFRRLGDLAYFRRPFTHSTRDRHTRVGSSQATQCWPEGVEVVPLNTIASEPGSRSVDLVLTEALERSYIDTLDCPELCGLRSIEDVLLSHKSVGMLDPRLWWLVTLHGKPAGCLLFSVVRETDSIELVYLGLGPELRGLGLGRRLLGHALQTIGDCVVAAEVGDALHGLSLAGGITLAVDTRNAPAVRLYREAGFQRTGTRIPLVKSI
jgi:ribosomal protein S18 acetylase RimI-like enzyme